MDFLKSAVASAIAKGPAFPYSFGDRVDMDDSIWILYNGTRREDGSNCSIFSFDADANKSRLAFARNALKKLRTLRHPGVIKVLDTVESDSHIYIATERLVPLRWHVKRKTLATETIKWGLFSVAQTLKFVNDDASSIHGNVKVASVYTSESGEWKLGGFEVLSSIKDDEAIIYTHGSLLPDSARYTPPELVSSGWDAVKRSPHSTVDSFNYGVLIYEVFNGDFRSADQAGQTKGIPPTMHASYRRLVSRNPKARLSVAHFLEQGKRRGSFFDTPLVKLTDGIDNLGVKSEEERDAFLSDVECLSDDFPEDFFKIKILPELLKAVEFGGGGPKAFGVVMRIAAKLTSDDFDAKVTPAIIRLFGNPDRAIRVCLLDNLPQMVDRLSQKVVNDKIFPQLVSGFTDLAPLVREQTLKSILTIITKLSDRTINGEVLKYLAKTANDEQPGIRTNTTICLGKIAKHLGTSNRCKVLVKAFTRSLRDPFVHARNAALMALAATSEFYSDEDCACKIMPVLCPLLIDKEKMVRDQASKTLDVFLHKTRKAGEGMSDTTTPSRVGSNTATPRMGTPQPGGVGKDAAGVSWTGWAISSFTTKLSAVGGEIESGSGSITPAGKASPALPVAGIGGLNTSVSALHRQAVKSPAPTSWSSRNESSATTPGSAFSPPEPDMADADDDFAWGDVDDVADDSFGDEDDGADAWGAVTPESSLSPSAKKESASSSSRPAPAGLTGTTSSSNVASPFGHDDTEPDFAGWLAAQAQKKKAASLGGGLKPLPKGLSKGAGGGIGGDKALTGKKAGTGAGAAAVFKKQQPVISAKTKKVNLEPKDEGDDNGWCDGW